VLVIDDEPNVAKSVRRTLAREHDVTVFTDPRAALTHLEQGERYDAIVCDLMMPELGGVQLHDALSAFAPEQAARMLFLTGGARDALARAFEERVGLPLLDKPYAPDELRAIVGERVGSTTADKADLA
jgi:CheY-like chemotaxis protein